jgi:hypothetical protein
VIVIISANMHAPEAGQNNPEERRTNVFEKPIMAVNVRYTPQEIVCKYYIFRVLPFIGIISYRRCLIVYTYIVRVCVWLYFTGMASKFIQNMSLINKLSDRTKICNLTELNKS